MSQKVKAPTQKGGSGFMWTIIAVLVIAAVVIGVFVSRGGAKEDVAEGMPQEDVKFTVTAKDNSIELAAKKVDKNAPVVEIYEDFSCPHCADVSAADHVDVKQALEDGKLKVKFEVLNFLDDGQEGHSTRAAGAVYAIAQSGDAKAFWNFHNYIMTEQQTVARQWGSEELAEAASAYDLDEDLIKRIREDEVAELGNEVGKANADELKERAGKVSSPMIFVDGQQYEIKTDEEGKPKSWVPDVVKK